MLLGVKRLNSVTYGPETDNQMINGDVVINASDITLRNITITGSLTLGEGIGVGNVTLQKVAVKGQTYVKGATTIPLENPR